MKYFQMYHRFNYEFDPPLEEKICIWLEWNRPITDANCNKFDIAMQKAMWEQCPESWKSHKFFGDSQDENIALSNKHTPELSWSSVMEMNRYESDDHTTYGKFTTSKFQY